MPSSELVTRWSSRKFWAAMVWQTVMAVLLWNDKLPSEAFVSITYLILGGYFVGNVAQHIWEPKK